MKHKLSITLLLLGMFLLTQFIGLYVVNSYFGHDLPYGLQTQENEEPSFLSIVFAFVFAFAIILILMKYRWKFVIKGWFFLVVTIALALSLNVILRSAFDMNAVVALVIAIPLAFLKIFRPHVLVHNITELLIYPGIAAVFVPILTPITVIALLILISFYDMWAVWKSGIMQKMAKFQMEELRLFGGFLLPSVSDKVKKQIGKIKQKYKGKEIPESVKKKKFKVNLAILGGGDVIFPIITSGVFLSTFGIVSALFVIFGSLVGLTYLFLITEKGKAYPAMPYISVGIFLGLLVWKVFFG